MLELFKSMQHMTNYKKTRTIELKGGIRQM